MQQSVEISPSQLVQAGPAGLAARGRPVHGENRRGRRIVARSLLRFPGRRRPARGGDLGTSCGPARATSRPIILWPCARRRPPPRRPQETGCGGRTQTFRRTCLASPARSAPAAPPHWHSLLLPRLPSSHTTPRILHRLSGFRVRCDSIRSPMTNRHWQVNRCRNRRRHLGSWHAA